jgi:hypothetical protein
MVGIAIIVSAYIVFGPGPTAFAGGKRVALSASSRYDDAVASGAS